MAVQDFLRIISPQEPVFLKDTWIQGGPERHVFMMATVAEYLKGRPPQTPLRILEIGTWMGASALTWAQALREYNDGHGHLVCVDSFTPYFDHEKMKSAVNNKDPVAQTKQRNILDEMNALLEGDYVYDICSHNLSTIPEPTTVSIFRESSREALPLFETESFDIIYIDGCHAYESVLADIAEAKRLIKPGGMICGDDLEVQLHECDRRFAFSNRTVDVPTDPKTGKQFHPGVTLAVGQELAEVAEYLGFWVVKKQESGRCTPVFFDKIEFVMPEHFGELHKKITLMQVNKFIEERSETTSPNPICG